MWRSNGDGERCRKSGDTVEEDKPPWRIRCHRLPWGATIMIRAGLQTTCNLQHPKGNSWTPVLNLLLHKAPPAQRMTPLLFPLTRTGLSTACHLCLTHTLFLPQWSVPPALFIIITGTGPTPMPPTFVEASHFLVLQQQPPAWLSCSWPASSYQLSRQ